MDQELRMQGKAIRDHMTHELRMVIFLFFCVLVIMVMFYHRINHQRTVLVPALIEKAFWVSDSAVSQSYLEEMTKYFIFLRFNVSAQNVIDQQRGILRYATPRAEKMLSSILKMESEPIIKNNISTLFYPHKIQINEADMSVDIEGEHIFIFMPNHIVRHRKSFHLAYEQTPVGIRLSQFHEVSHHD